MTLSVARGAWTIFPLGDKEEAMKIRIAFLACVVVALAGYTVSGKAPELLSEPPDFRITPPPPDLSIKVAALSGVWEATQTELGPSRVIVERINETWASMLQFWPDPPAGYHNGGWKRVRARVLPNGELLWGYPVKFTLRLAEDGVTLESKMERAGAITTTTLKRVGTL
jgi:hypothetical protein